MGSKVEENNGNRVEPSQQGLKLPSTFFGVDYQMKPFYYSQSLQMCFDSLPCHQISDCIKVELVKSDQVVRTGYDVYESKLKTSCDYFLKLNYVFEKEETPFLYRLGNHMKELLGENFFTDTLNRKMVPKKVLEEMALKLVMASALSLHYAITSEETKHDCRPAYINLEFFLHLRKRNCEANRATLEKLLSTEQGFPQHNESIGQSRKLEAELISKLDGYSLDIIATNRPKNCEEFVINEK